MERCRFKEWDSGIVICNSCKANPLRPLAAHVKKRFAFIKVFKKRTAQTNSEFAQITDHFFSARAAISLAVSAACC